MFRLDISNFFTPKKPAGGPVGTISMQKSAPVRNPKLPHPEDIKALIRKSGTSLADLSLRLGYSRGAVSLTLSQPWPALESAIAKHLGMTPEALWPDRYDREGHPLTFPASKRSRTAARRQRSNSRSA